MISNRKAAYVREAIGVFYKEPPLSSAIAELLASGFKHTELALLANKQIVDQSLGDLYSRTNEDADTGESPGIAFVDKDALGETAHSLGGGVFFVAVCVVMGCLVLATALIGGAMLAAIGAIVAVGAIGAMAATVGYQSSTEKLKEQVDKGHILLIVRVAEPRREKEVMAMLKKHGATDIEMLNAPLRPHETPESRGLSF